MLINEAFEWDLAKAERNLKKHSISFSEAATVFYDENAILISDPDHSIGEERFVLLGRSEKSNILVVVHCERNERLLLISARRATKQEKYQYQRGLK